MTEIKSGTNVPKTSKYAAKKAARIAAAKANEESSVKESTNFVKTEDFVVDDSFEFVKPQTTKVGKNNRDLGIVVPEHFINIAYIVKDNAAIRRFTSLGILNHLKQIGRIKEDATGKYVKFLWNKFQVTADGLKAEYSYTETFFIKALIGAFDQFANSAQETINEFLKEEGIINEDK